MNESTGKRIVIIGSGVAGLSAALEAVRLGLTVTVLTKDALGDGNSKLAQGGLSAVTAQGLAAGDSVQTHVADTLKAGAGHCGHHAVQEMCGAAGSLVASLEEHAVAFDKNTDGSYQLGLEAAHSAHRILHVDGDATGAGLIQALRRAVRSAQAAGQLEIIEHALAAELEFCAQRLSAVRYLHGEEELMLEADAVLLATGGLGTLYQASTNPKGATADGIALAAQAGAVISDAEFIQFHPTLVDPEAYPGAGMISEAVRGEGAILVTETGDRFMPGMHQRAELAPRDVVARAIHAQNLAGHRVFLDARGVEAERGAGFLARRFPSISARLKAAGLDLAAEPIPVVAAQHYAMGGIHTDTHGRSSVPGIYAAGECANTTVHGANRLASNSLLEAMVFARKAVAAMAQDEPGSACELDNVELGALPPVRTDAPLELPQLQALASEHLGVHRTVQGLQALLRVLGSSAPVAQGRRELIELGNLWITARIVAQAAAARGTSLGAHHRLDDASPGEHTTTRYGWVLDAAQHTGSRPQSKEVNA
ncbi:L-aspartate oxidase [Arthrobacter sp. MYb211]|uniref:L-aspartate oxidase n=1 Tax=unclassified Arthrobacter TaxID=235627 RepID=UPI000CFE24D3|nr:MULTISPECIES: FAD-dependent oxidoreductase [unclassified Arthrobacter]PRA10471.1 L-aspartate oxidase [Arthrobacter sp. MYb221]PRC06041.1 L-aspartate oxidase [Arthrobacter sp. MYb211]